ncbi:MAG TPA: class I SAM-dependent methyltransferase [Dehalococcoidia bacterium]|nr:class I SAM-dependent methyltransferase [Dehalococcoidia bacterium]
MDIFLNKALKSHPDALCFEFGTYKGRTAALIVQSIGSGSWLHAIDNGNYLDTAALNQLSERFTWHQGKSEQFCRENLQDIVGQKQIAFSHHDASHFFDNVSTELQGIFEYMAPSGIIVLDDFNDPYSQVRAAYYYLRYVHQFPFELLVIGFNKAILVHQEKFDYFEDYVLGDFVNDIEETGILCKLFRTDINIHSRNFFVAARAANDDPRYGQKFFGDTFYQQSRQILNDE